MFEQDNDGLELRLLCTSRHPKEQYELYMQGRNGRPGKIVTNIDGITKIGMHNYIPSRAFDVGIFDKGTYITHEEAYYALRLYPDMVQLAWGGNWNTKWVDGLPYWINDKKRFRDLPHFEVPKGAVG